MKGGLHFCLFILSEGTDDAHLFWGTFFRPTLFSHSILFSITCTSVTEGIMFNRRKLWWCESIITRVANKTQKVLVHESIFEA